MNYYTALRKKSRNTTEAIEKVEEGLISLLIDAEDAPALRSLFSNALGALYESLPTGRKNYGLSSDTRMGTISAYQLRPIDEGKLHLVFSPSEKYQKKTGCTINICFGTIDIRKGTYEFCTPNYDVPSVVRDTMRVMKQIDLDRVGKIPIKKSSRCSMKKAK